MGRRDQVFATVQRAVGACGTVHILVNNAQGFGTEANPQPSTVFVACEETNEDEWEYTLRTGPTASLWFMKAVLHGFPIFQYAWVVNDLDGACHRWVSAFGAGPFFTARHHKAEGYYRYRGNPKECDLSYAFGYCGPVMIQLIELHDDTPSIFHDMYKRGEEGFHHVAVLGYDFPKTRQHLLDQGLELANEMWSGADVCYFDARPQFGMFVEIHGAPQAILDHFAVWQRTHDEWDGVIDPIRDAVRLERQTT